MTFTLAELKIRDEIVALLREVWPEATAWQRGIVAQIMMHPNHRMTVMYPRQQGRSAVQKMTDAVGVCGLTRVWG